MVSAMMQDGEAMRVATCGRGTSGIERQVKISGQTISVKLDLQLFGLIIRETLLIFQNLTLSLPQHVLPKGMIWKWDPLISKLVSCFTNFERMVTLLDRIWVEEAT